ncbi:hypothetical protein Adt_31222 [Abeliophyllum distichum]|uniref:Uncharacterized protein n=1 Tax=Abeliophyllum distichum TaxID=126358 RepID=A0ABD1REB6_9LAMI
MSSGSDDSQNQSDIRTNPSIQGESPLSSSSSEVVEEVNQASPASCPSTPFASRREVCPNVPLEKVGGRRRTATGVPEMGGHWIREMPWQQGDLRRSLGDLRQKRQWLARRLLRRGWRIYEYLMTFLPR